MDRIKFDEIGFTKVNSKRSLLYVTFKDKHNNSYKWTPRWDDLRRIFWLAVWVEAANTYPKYGPWEYKFVNTSRAIISAAGLPESDLVRDLLCESKSTSPELANDPWSRTPAECYIQIANKYKNRRR